ncbi:MAG TPA: efflux RND transporter periplasmic adaptor subunit [Lacunisphaera sp.]|nr:efflux RND transporter periplasmic adaptor subunit [Lacunisphaera sp.]
MASSGGSLKKIVIIALVLAVAAAGAFTYYRRQQAEEVAPDYTTATVSKGDVVQVVTATGSLDAVLSVDVGSQISGLITKLFADFNTPVKEGQKLAELDPSTYQQSVRQAEANLASAQASYRLAELNAQRLKELFDKKLVTQQDNDQAQAQLQQAQAQLQINQATLENAKVNLARCTIYSPIDGIVVAKLTEVGKTVAAGLNVPVLFTIDNDLTKMQITAAVAEADIGAVAEGQHATFTVDAFPNRSFTGVISQVRNNPQTTNNVVTYQTIIDVKNDDLKLRPGMTANVSIEVARRDGTLRLPNAALRVRMPEGLALAAKEADGGKEKAAAPEARHSGGGGGGGGNGGGGMRRFFGADASPENRQKMREIMTEVGVDFRQGPPTPEQREQIRKLMVERGLITAEEAAAAAGARAGNGPTYVTRTVYRLPHGDKTARPEAVNVKIGITDGLVSEVAGGLSENDVIITSVTVNTQASARTSNPFGGPGRRF